MERFISRLVLGTIAPVVLFLAGWWGTLMWLGDSPLIPWMALAGLAAGVLVDLTWLRGSLDALYRLSPTAQIIVAVFYAVMIYGFFMGLPVPLLLVSAGWGFAAAHPTDTTEAPTHGARRAARGSALIMLIACLLTAWLAFREPSIRSQVRGMLGLAFTPSMAQLAAGSFVGGAALTAMAYALAAFAGRTTGGQRHSGTTGGCA